ncbi:LysE family translocator [Saccharopolyspora sp. WRP15-2]|uniref:LysE family translocator n=1 Tax=Saccharopolyspora oryzae TaxID=2997343 RepID=A0ABT4V547_9PSEU|nr:LysE family translocator [Saccharopolyspora oryzae]MDA3629078.1 LysE family translocator [Saccharopolyspora oryzae]
MDLVGSLPAFLLAVLLISASPGPAMALIFRRAALGGFRPAIGTVLGLEAGIYIWAIAAGAGLTALVAASETAYLVMRLAGAAFLVYLGIRSWAAVFRDRGDAEEPVSGGERGNGSFFRSAGEGLLVQLANPKALIFMFAFYPQFVPADWPLLSTTAVLALVQVIVETALYLVLAASVARAGAWFRQSKVRRRLEAITGTVLIALGLRVAASSQ